MNRNADCQPVQTEQGFTGDDQNRHEKRNGLTLSRWLCYFRLTR